MKPHTVGKIHMGKDKDDKWTVFEASVQTHLYYKTVDESGEEKTELLGSYIVGKAVVVVSCNSCFYAQVLEKASLLRSWTTGTEG